MVFDYLFDGITRQQIVLSIVQGLFAGVGWAFGSIIAIIFLELTVRKFLKTQFEKLAEAIKRIKK